MSYSVLPPPAVAPPAPPPPGRPAVVSAAAVLLWVMAAVGLIYAIVTLVVASGTVSRFRDTVAAGQDPELYITVVWLGAAIGTVLAVILFALYVVLGIALRRGSNAARIATLVVAVLGVLAGAGAGLTVSAERGGDAVAGSLGERLTAAYPSGWLSVNVGLAVAQIIAYLLLGGLVLGAPRAFFRRGDARPPAPQAHPQYGMPYPGSYPAPGGYGPQSAYQGGYGASGYGPGTPYAPPGAGGYGPPAPAGPGQSPPGAYGPASGGPSPYGPPPAVAGSPYAPPPTGFPSPYAAPPAGFTSPYAAPPAGSPSAAPLAGPSASPAGPGPDAALPAGSDTPFARPPVESDSPASAAVPPAAVTPGSGSDRAAGPGSETATGDHAAASNGSAAVTEPGEPGASPAARPAPGSADEYWARPAE